MSHPYDPRIERNLFVADSIRRLAISIRLKALAALAISVAGAAFFFLIVNT